MSNPNDTLIAALHDVERAAHTFAASLAEVPDGEHGEVYAAYTGALTAADRVLHANLPTTTHVLGAGLVTLHPTHENDETMRPGLLVVPVVGTWHEVGERVPEGHANHQYSEGNPLPAGATQLVFENSRGITNLIAELIELHSRAFPDTPLAGLPEELVAAVRAEKGPESDEAERMWRERARALRLPSPFPTGPDA